MRRFANLALLAAWLLPLPAFAQMGGGGGSGGGGSGGGGTGGGGTTSTGGTTGGTGSTGSNIGSALPNTGFSSLQQETFTGISGANVSGGVVNSTNILAPYYANPYFAGRAGTDGKGDPGGFGQPLAGGVGIGTGIANRNASAFTRQTSVTNMTNLGGLTGVGTLNTGVTGGLTTGSAGRTTTGLNTGLGGSNLNTGLGTGIGGLGAMGGRTAGLGGMGGMGFGGMMGAQQQGMIAQQAAPVAFQMVPRFNSTPVSMPQLQQEIRGALGRSSMISNAQAIESQVEGRVVVLRGRVRDEEEARTAEGIVRLTPGVRAVRNELTFPAP